MDLTTNEKIKLLIEQTKVDTSYIPFPEMTKRYAEATDYEVLQALYAMHNLIHNIYKVVKNNG